MVQKIQVSEWETWNAEVATEERFVSEGLLSRVREHLQPTHEFVQAFAKAFQRGPRQVAAAEIHADVDKEAERQLRFAERVMEYRQMYPGNAFLTIEQVKAICKRYDLVFAPDFMFAGEVPERNRAEMDAFRLHKKHIEMRPEEHDTVGSHLSARAVNHNIYRTSHVCESIVPTDIHAPWVMVLGQDFGLYSPKGFMGIRQWAELISIPYSFPPQDIFDAVMPVARTKKGWVRLDSRMVNVHHMSMRREAIPVWPSASIREFVAKLEFSMPAHLNWGTWSYQEDVCRVVICPVSMLHQSIPFRVSQEGEVAFSRSPSRENGFGYDPIILQPVDEGFLVVTKWDAEANLPEVAGQTN